MPKRSQESDKSLEIKFNISLSDQNLLELPGSSMMLSPSSKSGGKLSDYFDRLEYYLYNSKGTRIEQSSLDADGSATGFNVPSASLKPGKYTVVFLGRKEKSTGTSSAIYFGNDQASPYLAHSLHREVTDLFYTSQEFEVKKDATSINIALKRPGGKCKIIIEDNWPANVERIAMLIDGYTLFYPKSDNLAQKKDITLPIFKNYISSFELIDGVNVPKQTYVDCSYENFVFTNSSNATILNASVIAYDNLDKIIAKKTINEIKVERNKITAVKVKLFN